MRVAVTGTPGTGKTTSVEHLDTDLEVVHLNDLVREEGLTTGEDDDRDALVVDLDAVRERLADREDLLVESHLAHHLDVDRVVVLRCHPEELRRRLRGRGDPETTVPENAATAESSGALARKARENAGAAEPPRALAHKVRENAESEALDLVLAESVERQGADAVYEVDTTDRTSEAVADEIAAVLAGERDPAVGTVDFSDTLQP